ncbi:hypothetical protein [Thermoproteus tenax]|uniref:Uncharacterized protein n=1 Tax=Thermoproteus tenax (strain ATCC 35583 / DSM 2078 / JCM 9277 / NBRC 100435 / Kra 1) TaxID=768679 RepID=G4RQ78_THETK|nr:hypothetical protein [Thermoproteus tenax]CCC80715.1 hypothetical protein TTX_0036 [Thermoproteus tenax Kra 1]
MWAIYSSSYLYWFIYGGEFDVPAVLGKLVGLGYEVARAGYREGYVYLDPLPGGYAGRRVYEEGDVYLLANMQRGALGVAADKYQLVMRGAADVSRAIMELAMPEPPRAEFHASLGATLDYCRAEQVKLADVELQKSGMILTAGEPQGGDGIYISVNPMGGRRYMVYAIIGGRWGYVAEHAKRVNDLLSAVLSYISCPSK